MTTNVLNLTRLVRRGLASRNESSSIAGWNWVEILIREAAVEAAEMGDTLEEAADQVVADILDVLFADDRDNACDDTPCLDFPVNCFGAQAFVDADY